MWCRGLQARNVLRIKIRNRFSLPYGGSYFVHLYVICSVMHELATASQSILQQHFNLPYTYPIRTINLSPLFRAIMNMSYPHIHQVSAEFWQPSIFRTIGHLPAWAQACIMFTHIPIVSPHSIMLVRTPKRLEFKTAARNVWARTPSVQKTVSLKRFLQQTEA